MEKMNEDFEKEVLIYVYEVFTGFTPRALLRIRIT
jgi:hypothetical protein